MSSLSRLRNKMSAEGVPAILVSDITNVSWLTNFNGSFGYALITPTDATFLTDSRYTVQAGEQVKSMKVASYGAPKTFAEHLREQVQALGITKLGIEAHNVSLQTFEGWKDALQGIELISLKDFVNPLRMVKSEDEIQAIEECCGIADAAFQHVQRLFTPGVPEDEISLEIELYFRRQGGTCAFDTIVASGWRSALPHGRASTKKIERGDFLTLDFGCAKNGLNSDITRTVVIGEPTERQVEIYNQVLKAQLAALEMMKPGVKASDVDAKAREVFDEIGIAKHFGHGLGHGLGRLVHDFGRLGTSSTDVLEAGQVWTVEPGVYFDGWGGCRIEDDVLVTDDGIRILTKSPKELLVFG
jgi:Xaa-Pro aminopeptidase